MGLVAAILAVVTFSRLSDATDRLTTIAADALALRSLAHAPAVFLEGVALAFVYERLRWVMGGRWALFAPCLLFAAAHLPRSLAAGRPIEEVLFWFSANTLLPMMILGVVAKSRDVIWIAIPHYAMDVAIGAFHS